MKKILRMTLAGAILMLGACSDDDSSPKKQFSFDGETLSLQGAKLYLTREDTYNNHIYRDYFISDGTYVNGSGNEGWSLGDYEDATYFIAIELAAANGEEVAAGEYPLRNNWGPAEEDERISYFYLESGDDLEEIQYYNEDTNEPASIVVSGGVNPDETMTIKLTGTLIYYRYNGTNWVDEPVSGKFYYKGKVRDERETNMPTRSAQTIRTKGHQ